MQICPECGSPLDSYRCEDYCHGRVTYCTNAECHYEELCSCAQVERQIVEERLEAMRLEGVDVE